jgi:hypothetical protein
MMNNRTSPRLIVKWNLPRLAADLAARLEYLERIDDLGGSCDQSEDFLEPYNLSPDHERWVTMVAWGKQCVDCGDVRDHFMVGDRVWKQAGLRPNQCCCRGCLALRLGRPLEPMDFLR